MLANTPMKITESRQTKAAGDQSAAIDPMRRLIPTPHDATLNVMGRVLLLETNNSELKQHMIELFGGSSPLPTDRSDFLWRIIVEPDGRCLPPWPWRSTFSDHGIRFAQFGQRNFVAVDLEEREAVAFVSAGLFADLQGFTSPFIDTLFYMTAGALGLTPFAAACLRSGPQVLLILGPQNQGKTTASYLAAGDGVSFLTDQSVLLEVIENQLRAWADFVPAAFRPETLEYLPELVSKTQRFSYGDFNFYYMRKEPVNSHRSDFVVPTCTVILERATSSVPNLASLTRSDVAKCLSEYILFEDEDRFEAQQAQVLAALADIPAFRLSYDSNPGTAAPFLRNLLTQSGDVVIKEWLL